jgi:hypothetical protein
MCLHSIKLKFFSYCHFLLLRFTTISSSHLLPEGSSLKRFNPYNHTYILDVIKCRWKNKIVCQHNNSHNKYSFAVFYTINSCYNDYIASIVFGWKLKITQQKLQWFCTSAVNNQFQTFKHFYENKFEGKGSGWQ